MAPSNRSRPILVAQKVAKLPASQGSQIAAYCVLETPAKAKGQDRRQPPRKRTRLRSGKILDRDGRFLIECQVHDRSSEGAQLRLMGTIAVPRYIRFFDDEQGALLEAEVIWRKKAEIGIRFLTKLDAVALRQGRRSALGGKYYAVS